MYNKNLSKILQFNSIRPVEFRLADFVGQIEQDRQQSYYKPNVVH